jgi:hypothetical protein
MSRLRQSTLLKRLATLLIVLGLVVQGLALPATASVPDGICHADTTPNDQPATPEHAHDACCVLCHAPAAGIVPDAPWTPLPGLAFGEASLSPRPSPQAPRPAPAFYASRAPPVRS